MGTRWKLLGAPMLAALLLALAPTESLADDAGERIVVDAATGEVLSAVIVPSIHSSSDDQIVEPNTTVVVDAATGKIVATQHEDKETRSASRRKCSPTEACWTSDHPIGDFAFHGVGVTTGSWPYRETFHSGPYVAKICWKREGKTACPGFWIASGSKLVFAQPVTGVQVTLR